MKISLKKTKFVENILNGDIKYNINVEDTIEFYSSAKLNVDSFLKDFVLNKNYEIFIISKSFFQAFNSAKEKLAELMKGNKDFYKIHLRRIIFFEDSVYFFEQKEDELKLVRFDSGTIISSVFTNNININKKSNFDFFVSAFVIDHLKIIKKDITESVKMYFLSEEVNFIHGLQVFIKYCPLENKFIKGNSKTKIDNTKYINESKLDLTILNSMYFTNIYRTEGFKVKGHFRLQPYKESKKLIWISEYNKEGYSRKATKIKNEID